MLGREIVYIPQNGHEFLDPSRSIRRQLFDSIGKLGVAALLSDMPLPAKSWRRWGLHSLKPF